MLDLHRRADAAYARLPQGQGELEHAYGSWAHLLSDPFLLSRLAHLCSESTGQPQFNDIVRELYSHLLKVVLNSEFPRETLSARTRMAAHSPHGVWQGEVLARRVPVVVVNLMRAGSVPSQLCFDTLNPLLEPAQIRLDHVMMSRATDAEERVTGASWGGSKIGGGIDDAFVLLPDPMGATGSSMSEVIGHYKSRLAGRARRFIAMNLIVTPEYLRRIHSDHPDVVVYALRLDRGASSDEVLREKPGVRWSEESGLTDRQYIVPGGGGFGEIMNNAYC